MNRGQWVQRLRALSFWLIVAAVAPLGIGAGAEADVIGPAFAPPSAARPGAEGLRTFGPPDRRFSAPGAAVVSRSALDAALTGPIGEDRAVPGTGTGLGRTPGVGFQPRRDNAGLFSFGGGGPLAEGVGLPFKGLPTGELPRGGLPGDGVRGVGGVDSVAGVAGASAEGRTGALGLFERRRDPFGRGLPMEIIAPDQVLIGSGQPRGSGFTAVSPVRGFDFRGEPTRRHIISGPGVLGLLGVAATGFVASRRMRRGRGQERRRGRERAAAKDT